MTEEHQPPPPESADNIARHVGQAMFEVDRATRSLGIELDEIGPGFATLSLRLGAAMANGHGTAHGGLIFTLADSAFAFVCNSHGERAVAAHCSITFLAPARPGERLIATAREVVRRGRNGIYDVSVSNDDGIVAAFRGQSRTIGGSWLDDNGR